MNSIRRLAQGFVSLGVLLALAGALLWGLAVILRAALQFLFDQVDPTVATAVVGGAVTIFVSVGGVLLTRFLEKRKLVQDEIRREKLPIYAEVIASLFRFQNAAIDGGIDQAQFEKWFREVTPKLITWASDDALIAYSRWRRTVNQDGDPKILFDYEEMLKALRKDIGHSGLNVRPGDLLGLFVTDINNYLEQ